MSRMRKLLGLWIVLAFYLSVPFAYYLVIRAMDQALALPPFLPGELNAFLAAISVFAGIFWASWAYSYLHFVGKGSPVELFGVALLPTEVLVTGGPYAYTRNPMLIGTLFLLLAVALYANSISGVVIVPILAFFTLVYIKRFEEPALRKRFRDKYSKYQRTVPALIPSTKPHVP